MKKTKIISAFAYNTATLIEDFIIRETDNLIEKNKLLEAKILNYSARIKGTEQSKEYDEYFGITTVRGGKV